MPKRFPAELHIVHVKEDFVGADGSVDYSGAFSADDGLAVLGIFIDDSAETLSAKTKWFSVR